MIAALFVQTNGCYYGLLDVDPWDKARDARTYAGPYAFDSELPSLRWGFDPYQRSQALVSWCGNHVSNGETRPRVGKDAAAATPIEFRDLLISIASGCAGMRRA